MSTRGSKLPVAMISGVVLLGSIAAVFLIHNFTAVGLADTWPAVLVAVGLTLGIGGYFELGLAVGGTFLLVLLANLEIIAPFSKSWPFILVWIAILVVFAFVRNRSAGKKQAP